MLLPMKRELWREHLDVADFEPLNGRDVRVNGDTYKNRLDLHNLGMRWDAEKKVWRGVWSAEHTRCLRWQVLVVRVEGLAGDYRQPSPTIRERELANQAKWAEREGVTLEEYRRKLADWHRSHRREAAGG